MFAIVQVDAWDPVAGATVSLCAASHDDPLACHANDSLWWPAIAKLPTLRYDFFDGAFGDQITAPSSNLTLQTEPWPNFGRYSFADARFRLWTADASTPTIWTLRFDGRVTEQPEIESGAASVQFAVDDRWLDGPLLSTYAGTTGAEGPLAMKGQAKPLALGAPRYVPGKLIDSINSVYQVSSYGSIQEFEAALAMLIRYAAPAADYANYAALVAAAVPPGAWATCKAAGLARFGAPPTGQVCFLIKGDSAGTDGWSRKPGQLIRRLAILSGGTGKIDDASLNALDVARPYNISLYVDEQTTARELIQQIAASVNAVAVMSWTGQLFVIPVGIGTPTATLAADGSSLPPVSSVKQIGIAPPWKRLAIGAERAWTVHALSDIAFTAPLVPLGLHVLGTIYREGNIVEFADGSQFLYVNTSPSSGNAPPAPTFPPAAPASTSYWFQIKPPIRAIDIYLAPGQTVADGIAAAQAEAESKSKMFYATSFPLAANSSENDQFYDEDDRNKKYRRLPGDGVVSIGGIPVTIAGASLGEYAWTPADNTAIANFDARNDRSAAAIPAPTIPPGGAAIDHVLNTDGSVDISFEWAWSGDEATIDGWTLLARSSATGETYTFGSAPSEEIAIALPADRRAFFIYGAPANRYYTFAVQGFRVVDPDVAPSGRITTAVVKASLAGENPYLPSANVAFAGDVTGTVNGTAVALVSGAVTNFNLRNDRNGTALVVPSIAVDGTAVDHVVNTDGSVDLSFEWLWGGTDADIDGFDVLLYSDSVATPYVIGTSAAAENVFSVPASRRAAIFSGVPANRYYTLAIRAFRVVDPDIAASGRLTSAWVKPSIAGENPYQPASSVTFAGNVSGTINSTSVATIQAGALNAVAGLDSGGNVLPGRVDTSAIVSGAVIRSVGVQNSVGSAITVAANGSWTICSVSLLSVQSTSFFIQASTVINNVLPFSVNDHKTAAIFIEARINGGAWVVLPSIAPSSRFIDYAGTLIMTTSLPMSLQILTSAGAAIGNLLELRLVGTCAGATNGEPWESVAGNLFVLEIKR